MHITDKCRCCCKARIICLEAPCAAPANRNGLLPFSRLTLNTFTKPSPMGRIRPYSKRFQVAATSSLQPHPLYQDFELA